MAAGRVERRDSQIALSGSFTEPKRTGGIAVHFTFLALGVSSLLPWNALIIALPFFLEKLEGTGLHDTFASWISFVFNGVGLLSIGLTTWLGHQFIGPFTCTLSMASLALLFGFLAICYARLSMASLALLFGFLAIVPFFDLPATTFFTAIISASVMLAAAGGLLQTATITFAPVYGPSAITYYMAGSALSAVGVSALQVFTASTSNAIELPSADSSSWSATVCYATALSAVGVSALQVFTASTSNAIELPSADSSSWSATVCYATSTLLVTLALVSFHLLTITSPEFKLDDYKDCSDLPISETTRLLESVIDSPLPPPLRPSGVGSNNRWRFGCNFAIFYAGVVTLGVFPAITTRIEPVDPRTNPLVFNALHFLVFNIADLIGRAMVSVELFPSSDTALAIYSLARTIFVPAFMVCNAAGHWPTIITSDLAYMLVLFAFGVTCGHLTTLSLVSASQYQDPEVGGKETREAQFWMMSGYVVGGIASFGIGVVL
ncbi:unnamed protein product [Rhizoctonia solani]|uniref:Nucleoside transporter n=1 Tax=Rhizoctonia solani TaxID=456999 RepID=A0A8H3AYN3_9AGAM|nr:unnamed protein product [Rhizoctonia solani]